MTVPGISNHPRGPAETPVSVHSLDLAKARRELLAEVGGRISQASAMAQNPDARTLPNSGAPGCLLSAASPCCAACAFELRAALLPHAAQGLQLREA